MATTMTLIAKQTVGSGGAASVTFSNIPQTYTDLKLLMSGRMTSNNIQSNPSISFNGSSSNWSYRFLFGTGSSPGSSSGSSNPITQTPAANATANTFSNAELYIPNYTSSNYKSISSDGVSENNATAAYAELWANLWSVGDAITSITITGNSAFVEYSTFYLYGISNSTTTQNTTVPYAYGGDVITTDGTYWYHAFKYSGSFVPQKDLTADVLVVAGGGGGLSRYAGGGGAGGLCQQSGRSLTTGSYPVVIGAGGAGVDIYVHPGNNGSNTTFNGITAIGGGYGGFTTNDNTGDGQPGGSGGGGGGYYAPNTDGGASTQTNSSGATGYGYAGGNGITNESIAGGGGGAGAVGQNGSGSQGAGNAKSGNGGVGRTDSLLNAMGSATVTGQLSSGNYYYAGGGGGGGRSDANTTTPGTGGLGGGGAGTDGSTAGTNGTANTGGGAGSSWNAYGGNGGSGIVIIRYAV